MVSKSTKIQDFDTDKIVSSDQHSKDIGELDKRISALEKRFGTNEKIADTLCETSEKAVKMQEMLAKTFVRLICTDEQVKDGIIKLVHQTDRKWTHLFLKRGGFALWSGVIFLLGIAVKVLADHYSHLPPN